MSIALRAALAVALLVGFYVLALGIAGGLLYLPYAEWVYAHRIHPKLLFIGVAGAGAIMWGILPRSEAFTPPGPELAPKQHPRLFSVVNELATATGQEPPREVYLVPDVNAFVASRGGVMGFGGHRIMGLGLPLLQVLTIPELRAVLAHEFGHYHGGDVGIGPLIYQTRSAIGRTIGSLGDDSFLRYPFLWYGKTFLRVSHAVSRHQERTADALAAKVVGAAPLARALEKVAGAAGAFGPYFGELVTALQGGCRPPIAQGFAMFVSAPDIVDAVAKLVDERRTEPADPFDTHPPLGERLTLLGNPTGSDPDTRLAITLLDDLPAVEAALARSLAPEGRPLRAVGWEEVGMVVNVERWRLLAKEHPAAFASITWDNAPGMVRSPAQLLSKLNLPGLPDDPDARQGAANFVVMAWAGLQLVDAGWTVQNLPGEPIRVVRGDVAVDLYAALTTPAQWAELTRPGDPPAGGTPSS